MNRPIVVRTFCRTARISLWNIGCVVHNVSTFEFELWKLKGHWNRSDHMKDSTLLTNIMATNLMYKYSYIEHLRNISLWIL